MAHDGTILPHSPFDGQEFIDANRIRYVYDAQLQVWVSVGRAETIPLATDGRNGLLSAADKIFLDSLPPYAGGFGIIVNTRLLLSNVQNPEGVLVGDITLVSDSLDISCLAGPNVPNQTIGFKLRESFLRSLNITVSGSPGPPGDVGPPGRDGRDGTYTTLKGDKGPPGANRTDRCNFIGIVYEDQPGVCDEAVVDLKISRTAELSYTVAKLDIPPQPAAPVAANQVVVTEIVRAVEWPSRSGQISTLDGWVITKPTADPVDLDVQLVRLADDENACDKPQPFAPYPLSDFIRDVVAYYKAKLVALDDRWRLQIKREVERVDTTARNILGNVAQQLALCRPPSPTTPCPRN